MNKEILLKILISFSIITLSACVSVPLINEGSISNINSGKTTKSEIIKFFGIPDIIVCDSATTITPKNSHLSRYIMNNQKQASNSFMNNYLKYLNAYIENRKNYFLSEDQITLIYLDPFGQSIGVTTGDAPQYAPLEIDIEKMMIAGNELAVFIDKKKNIVSDYAYRKEWNWEEYNILARMFIINSKDRSVFFSKSEIEKFLVKKYCGDTTN
jgi:hypothetical protein